MEIALKWNCEFIYNALSMFPKFKSCQIEPNYDYDTLNHMVWVANWCLNIVGGLISKVASGLDGWLYLDDVFVLLCCVEIQAELDVSELDFIVERFGY